MDTHDPASIITGLFKNPHSVGKKATELLCKTAPKEANCVLGVTLHQTPIEQNKKTIVMTTVMGTAVRLEEMTKQEVAQPYQPHGGQAPGSHQAPMPDMAASPDTREPGKERLESAEQSQEPASGKEDMPRTMSQPPIY